MGYLHTRVRARARARVAAAAAAMPGVNYMCGGEFLPLTLSQPANSVVYTDTSGSECFMARDQTGVGMLQATGGGVKSGKPCSGRGFDTSNNDFNVTKHIMSWHNAAGPSGTSADKSWMNHSGGKG